ncbi:MAG: flagellar motor protein MotB [Betaproteobacteria bacterium]|jgi:chemotaxis protein MotB|nr:flagellar motor protein MotB [Betaproteobacteria bacterium UKL13-2]HCG52832.1 motility protein MotB [Betaproteobacteria bacterium]
MAAKEAKQPIIVIKRIKKGHHAHHGGAWKIAYADFVTAMMAFFLLMWLLGSTSQGDLKGISDYFNAPLKVAMLGGRGAGDASSLIQGGGTDLSRRDGQVRNGDVVTEERKRTTRAARMEAAKIEAQRLSALKAKVEAAILSTPKFAEFAHQVKLDLTPDGLRIQIVDDQQRPMFDSGAAIVKPYMRDLLQNIGGLLQGMDARVTLSGHTDSKAFGNAQRGYSNWELSADRANASRRELLAGGMAEERIFRVVGLAASVPLNAEDPAAAINRRISIIVMNKQAEERLMNGGESKEASDLDDVRDVMDDTARAQQKTPSAD